MGNKQPANIKDEYLAGKSLIPSEARFKRNPKGHVIGDIGNATRGLLTPKEDQRKVWGVFSKEQTCTHSCITCLLEAKWEGDAKDYVILGTGFLIGDLNSENEGVIRKTPTGYSVIQSKWLLTAAHNIFNEKYGICSNVRIRVPNPLEYHKHRAAQPMLDPNADRYRDRRFENSYATDIFVHPSFEHCADPFEGTDIGLIKLDQSFTRVGLSLGKFDHDWSAEVLVVGGYPAQKERQYHLYVCSSRYRRLDDNKIVDTKYGFKKIEETRDGCALIYYSNQVTSGQSGGPISGYTNKDKPGFIVGLHVNEGEDGDVNTGTFITPIIRQWIQTVQSGMKRGMNLVE